MSFFALSSSLAMMLNCFKASLSDVCTGGGGLERLGLELACKCDRGPTIVMAL